jgi:ankyrin only family protein
LDSYQGSSIRKEEMDSVTKLKDFGTNELQDSGFLSGFCTTESDLSGSQSEYQLENSSSNHAVQDSGVDLTEKLSKLDLLNKDDYPVWEYFFIPDDDGDNQLHIGVMQGYMSAVSTLISLIPHPSVLDFQNNLGQTALHLSILTRQPRMTHLLVSSGAKLDMQDCNGNTPLHLVAENGDVDCLQALMTGISTSQISPVHYEYDYGKTSLGMPNIDLINFDGLAPIHLAAKGGHVDVIRALHWLGTNLNIGDGKGGRTALHYAIAHDQILAAHCLINECGSGLEVENYSGFTPYEMAKECKNSLFAQELIRAGAVPYESESMDESSSDSESELSCY